jgi:hypothetical protein
LEPLPIAVTARCLALSRHADCGLISLATNRARRHARRKTARTARTRQTNAYRDRGAGRIGHGRNSQRRMRGCRLEKGRKRNCTDQQQTRSSPHHLSRFFAHSQGPARSSGIIRQAITISIVEFKPQNAISIIWSYRGGRQDCRQSCSWLSQLLVHGVEKVDGHARLQAALWLAQFDKQTSALSAVCSPTLSWGALEAT